ESKKNNITSQQAQEYSAGVFSAVQYVEESQQKTYYTDLAESALKDNPQYLYNTSKTIHEQLQKYPEEKVHLVDKKRFKDTLDNPKGVIHKHDIEPGQEEDFAKSKQAAKQTYEATHALGDTGKKIREKYSKDFYSATIFEDMDSLRETTTAMNTEIAVQAEDNEQATRYVQDSQRLLTTE